MRLHIARTEAVNFNDFISGGVGLPRDKQSIRNTVIQDTRLLQPIARKLTREKSRKAGLLSHCWRRQSKVHHAKINHLAANKNH